MTELEKKRNQEEWLKQFVLTEEQIKELIRTKFERAVSKINLVNKWRESIQGCS